MASIRRLWMPVLLVALAGALGAVMLAGPLGARPEARAVLEPRVTVTRTITVAAAAFSPSDDSVDFVNNGVALWATTGGGYFVAPLFFEAPEVTIRKITLFAIDNSAADDVCVSLERNAPTAGTLQMMGRVCSSGVSAAVGEFSETALSPRRITGAYGPYLHLSMPMSYPSLFYAVRIIYSFETAA